MIVLAEASWQIYGWIWTGYEVLNPWQNILEIKIPKHTKITVCRNLTPRSLVERRRRFGEATCIIFQDACTYSRCSCMSIKRNTAVHTANQSTFTQHQSRSPSHSHARPIQRTLLQVWPKMLKPLPFQLCTFELSKSHENTRRKYQLHRTSSGSPR
jgi:hypothetical protein